MTLRVCAIVLLHVWSYHIYDMTLSTERQQRHMINIVFKDLDLCYPCQETLVQNISF